MADDALLRLSGASIDVPTETVTADGVAGGGYVYLGPNQPFRVEVFFGSTFDRTTGNETFDATVKIATDAAGGSATTVGSISQQTENTRGLDSTETADTLGMVNPAAVASGRTTEAKPYAGVTWDVGGTTPSAAGVYARIVPEGSATLRSGI